MEDGKTAKLAVLEDNKTDIDTFVKHLAAYCNQYIMEIAKPIMEHAEDLYKDDSIVKLIDLWFEADRQYDHRRQSYLVQWFENKRNGYDWKPLKSYEWENDKRHAYRDALDALLVR